MVSGGLSFMRELKKGVPTFTGGLSVHHTTLSVLGTPFFFTVLRLRGAEVGR